MRGVSTTKLLILAILGFCALVLGSAVLTLQLYVQQERFIHQKNSFHHPIINKKRTAGTTTTKLPPGTAGTTSTQSTTTTTTTIPATTTTTIKSARPISSNDIRLSSSYSSPPQGKNIKLAQDAYWRQAARELQQWDALLLLPLYNRNDDYDKRGSSSSGGVSAHFALQRAAELGHPHAQHYLANAYASGIWPFPRVNGGDDEITTKSNKTSHTAAEDSNSSGRGALPSSLYVSDEWSPSQASAATAMTDHPHHHPNGFGSDSHHHHQQQQQLNQAFLWWRMAAMGGNIEAAVALAHRIAILEGGSASSPPPAGNAPQSTQSPSSCPMVLPYLEAAAHGIMDELEASSHSRAKIIPHMDQHILSHVHMHGGTSSQLDYNNKPYESKEAIQFYHIKATTTPWNTRLLGGNKENEEDNKNHDASIDLQAAYTLAVFYHFGQRGVPQNLTQSLLYYEIAANQRHWESAGVAGTFYLWGMGTEQNVEMALKYFKIGAPYDLELCRRIHEQVLNSDLDAAECDATSLNGLGVLHLLGIKDVMEVDLNRAEKYFALAKELGNADAMYNLAMMWLGWKTHFKHVSELTNDGVSTNPYNNILEDLKENTATFALHYSERTEKHQKGPTPGEIQEAVKLLISAANKNHLQAKHRLAMMYSQGIQIQTSALMYDALKPSCSKAMALYQWIVDNASLQRSKRLRAAYQAYTEGDLDVSLRNYLAVAETGSDVGQVNAAFLLERGTCLGLSITDCAKASVRLWKAAASKGNTEACLRVGDFYYYGRLREKAAAVGPFGWVQYLLYPEQHLPGLLSLWYRQGRSLLIKYFNAPDESEEESLASATPQRSMEEVQHHQEILVEDLSMAAHFYHEGAEKHRSPRANFNLGFMYEFGLGLKQDFPLAKRHYDLARTMSISGEAEVAVQIALWAMTVHEAIVKWNLFLEEQRKRARGNKLAYTDISQSGHPPTNAGYSRSNGRTEQDVVLSHIFNWSSLLIVVLICLFLQIRKLRGHRQRT